MSNVKNYIVTASWFDDAAVTRRVDHDVLTQALATEINDFWSDSVSRLDDEGGDVVRAVIRLFGSVAIRYYMALGGAAFGPYAEGERNQTDAVIKNQGEGWPEYYELGILIVAAEVPAVGYSDVTLVAV